MPSSTFRPAGSRIVEIGLRLSAQARRRAPARQINDGPMPLLAHEDGSPSLRAKRSSGATSSQVALPWVASLDMTEDDASTGASGRNRRVVARRSASRALENRQPPAWGSAESQDGTRAFKRGTGPHAARMRALPRDPSSPVGSQLPPYFACRHSDLGFEFKHPTVIAGKLLPFKSACLALRTSRRLGEKRPIRRREAWRRQETRMKSTARRLSSAAPAPPNINGD